MPTSRQDLPGYPLGLIQRGAEPADSDAALGGVFEWQELFELAAEFDLATHQVGQIDNAATGATVVGKGQGGCRSAVGVREVLREGGEIV
jgi:hypothetical protein